ncbi:acid phosphatase [Pseudonocardiaceae bacterium YIM PH 21723]|nr:acid phosphatase [Pseudonocardiaceae bacterium YIM PH 21723]
MNEPVFVLRHGATEWSANGRHTGRTDIPLTEHGRDQARAAGGLLARLLPPDARVLVSPRSRARETAELAGFAGYTVTPELAEWDYGDYEGLTTPQIRETVPDWTVWTHPCPGGETAEQVADRADQLIKGLEQPTLLVGHGHFGRVLMARWLRLPATAGVHFGQDPAAVSQLGFERGVPQLTRLNLTNHAE